MAAQAGNANVPQFRELPDDEKRKIISEQLLLQLHALRCLRREERVTRLGINASALPPCPVPQCPIPHCSLMKEVIRHLRACADGRYCPYPHCSSSRQIMNHWNKCGVTASPPNGCPVCLPVVKANQKKKAAKEDQGDGPASEEEDSLDASDDDDQMDGTFVMLEIPHLEGFEIVGQLNLTPQQRQVQVEKIVRAIFSNSPVHLPLEDGRLKNLVAYAERVEEDFYCKALSIPEYDRLLSDKIVKIKQELEVKREKRRQMVIEQAEQAKAKKELQEE